MKGENAVSQQKLWWQEAASVEEALEHGLTAEEFKSITDLLGRPLTILEVGIFSALYSEHCSYKSSKVHLKTLPTQGERVIHGPGENAGVVDIGDGKAVVFKIESHNHPSFIEPFQGAATGVGGILRDVFTMGARPIALMNALRFGSADVPRTPYLVKRCVSGIGTYGNSVGVPTVGGEVFFHESYNGNCLVNAFALGIVDHDQIFLGQAAGIGNSILYVGSKTGRDGIHGATMASESFGESSEEKRPTVQVGDPFQEKLLIEACLEAMQTGHIIGIQDMGAAGMTSSSFEMADRAGTGLRIDLDKVPQREEGMNPYEIMLSESQERMLLVVAAGKEQKVCEVFEKWGLDAVQIGEVEEGEDVRLFWHGKLVSSIRAKLVTSSVPQYRWPTEIPADYESRLAFDVSIVAEPDDLAATWLQVLGHINIASRAPIFEQYDSTVRCNTVIHPGGDAALVRVKSGRRAGKFNKEKGIAMTLDCNSRYCAIDPRHGTALSVAESYRNITSCGAEPIGISNCLNFGSPERPTAMWQFAEAVKGLGDAARAFGVPVVSGNVSLYNETKGKAIYPTPQIAMVGLIEDASLAVDTGFRKAGDVVFVIGETREEDLGGTEYVAIVAGIEKGRLPNLNYDLEISTGNVVRELVQQELLVSCHDVSTGGLAVALAECCFSRHGLIGASLAAEEYEGRTDALLFAETGARYIISCEAESADRVRSHIEGAGLTVGLSGVVGGDQIVIREIAEVSLVTAYEQWSTGLEREIFQAQSSAVAANSSK